jgi:hypothetical protein
VPGFSANTDRGRRHVAIVRAGNGSNRVIEAGGTVVLVGSAGMSRTDHAGFTNTQVLFDRPH